MDIFDADIAKIDPAARMRPAHAARRVHRVGVVLCPQLSLASLGLLMDVFRMGNQLPGAHRFALTRVSQDGSSVAHTDGDLRVDGDASLLASMDLVVVPSLWTAGAQAVAQNPGLVEALRTLPDRVLVVTMCTGAYMLAASGRLDHCKATTHWMLADELQVAYPQVAVDPQENLIRQGSLICSGGSLAGVDACLHAVQLLTDRDTTKALARMLVTDVNRGPQTLYMPPHGWRRHADKGVRALQSHIESHFAQPLGLEDMARQIPVSYGT